MTASVRAILCHGRRHSRGWWKYVLLFLAVSLAGTLILHHQALQDNILREMAFRDEPSSVFVFRARDLQGAGLHKTPAAPDAVATRSRLIQAQKELFQRVRRPPDSAYNINVSQSEAIPLDRDIADTRPAPCRDVHYELDSLPRTSVIIPFYNEALSMLLRTIHSVLNRTSDRLLEEIILVDDCSTYEYLGRPLDQYVDLLPKVKLLRNTAREGLVRSRLRGCQISVSPIVVFLDAHSEVNVGWLEPILVELRRHPNTIIQPFVDGIDASTLVYSKPNIIYRGGFSWDLRYVWIKVPDHLNKAILEEGVPFWSPTLVGCAMAVNKTYFYSIGAFDEDQYIWGGENLELAFRTWQCGGSVRTLPCSRVGHVFRNLPYRNDRPAWLATWQKNLMRVADVWMDDYARYFYSSTRVYSERQVDYTPEERASLKRRIKQKEQLKCKDFEWYLNNVIPELPVPSHDAVYHGEITNLQSKACWAVLPDNYITMTYSCFEHKTIIENTFTLTKDGLLTYRDKCVKFLYPKPTLKVVPCPDTASEKFGIWSMMFPTEQNWGYVQVRLQERPGLVTTFCAMQVTSAVEIHKKMQMPQASPCNPQNIFQAWIFTYRFDYTDRFIENLAEHARGLR